MNLKNEEVNPHSPIWGTAPEIPLKDYKKQKSAVRITVLWVNFEMVTSQMQVKILNLMHHFVVSLQICKRVIQKVSSDKLLKRKKNLFPNHSYCHLMYISYTTFQHSFHHCWGTCHSRAPIFVSLHRKMMPPAMQTTC
jgi:hypothetical protein